jgi:hypothetical protein
MDVAVQKDARFGCEMEAMKPHSYIQKTSSPAPKFHDIFLEF